MQRLRARLAALAAQRLRAPLPPAAGAKKGKSVDRGPAKTGELSRDVVPGLAINKGDPEPALRPDSEYPAWLWTLLGSSGGEAAGAGVAAGAAAGAGAATAAAATAAGAAGGAAAAASSSAALLLPETATVAELQRAYERGGGLSLPQMRRLFRLRNKRRVRDNNAATAKK
jgi:hypothetical protein